MSRPFLAARAARCLLAGSLLTSCTLPDIKLAMAAVDGGALNPEPGHAEPVLSTDTSSITDDDDGQQMSAAGGGRSAAGGSGGKAQTPNSSPRSRAGQAGTGQGGTSAPGGAGADARSAGTQATQSSAAGAGTGGSGGTGTLERAPQAAAGSGAANGSAGASGATETTAGEDPTSTSALPIVADQAFAQWPVPNRAGAVQQRPSYTVTDKTVTDNVTQLVWQRLVPARYDACGGDKCSWQDARNYCASSALAAELGGSGWRLPSKIELESLVDETRSSPAIDVEAFPGTPPTYFWTVSADVSYEDRAWHVHFDMGHTSSWQAQSRYSVRCVR